MLRRLSGVILSCIPVVCFGLDQSPSKTMELVQVSTVGKQFVLSPSGKPFVPWGFNYDHDENEKERLLEDYWAAEWSKVEEDFGEMQDLGANVVRIHLQLGKFMQAPDKLNKQNLEQLERLVALAEEKGLYIDLTGLGNYRESDIPEWYRRLSEEKRWSVHARFWEAIALRLHKSPAIFCYNLMNEPAVPAERQKDWQAPPFENGRHYVEYIAMDPGTRSRLEIGRKWLRTLTKAIRKHDPKHLITVGTFLINDQADHLPIGATPEELVSEIDFISVHIYPREGKLRNSLDVLKRLGVGKPVVVEEMAPLYCSVPSLGRFIETSGAYASGWMGFYWGKTLEEYRQAEGIKDALMLGWLDLMRNKPSVIKGKNDKRHKKEVN